MNRFFLAVSGWIMQKSAQSTLCLWSASCVSRDLRPYSLRGLAFAFVVLCDAQIIAHKTIIVISKRRRKSDAIAGLLAPVGAVGHLVAS